MKYIFSPSPLRKNSREGERQTGDQRDVSSGRRTLRVVGLGGVGRLQGLVGDDGLRILLSEGDQNRSAAARRRSSLTEIHPLDHDLGHRDHRRLWGGGGGGSRFLGGGSCCSWRRWHFEQRVWSPEGGDEEFAKVRFRAPLPRMRRAEHSLQPAKHSAQI